MPQSGVTSDDSWYLTSFVILSFCCLSVCLTSSHRHKRKSNLSQWRIPWVLGVTSFVQRDESCTLWLWRWCVVDSLRCRLIFRTERIARISINSTNFTHIWSSLANQWSFFVLPRILWISWPAMESTGYSDMPPRLTKGFYSSVHWTAPPSPKFPAEFYRCCSLG